MSDVNNLLVALVLAALFFTDVGDALRSLFDLTNGFDVALIIFVLFGFAWLNRS